MKFYDLRVAAIIPDTKESVLIRFETNGLREKFDFKAGQYLTLEKVIEGETVRRCYSLCSSPYEEHLTIAVKKVNGGLISTALKEGDNTGKTISVGTPEGNFYVEPDPTAERDFYFIAAGSGITPVMSMMKTILEKEPLSRVYLLYGNKDAESIMLKEEIQKLQENYGERFYLENCFSCLNPSFWSRTLKKKGDFHGRISEEILDAWLKKYPASQDENTTNYYVCGPGEMIEETINYLESRGIEESRIHAEYFTIAQQQKKKTEMPVKDGTFAPTDRAHVKVKLDGEEINIEVGQEMTILEAVEDAGYYPPFSCRSGTCSTCMAKCEKGKVEMDVDVGLMPDEKEDGYILTCQSRVASKDIEINYDF